MTLLEQIDKCWTMEAEEKASAWAQALLDNKCNTIDAGKKFHEWPPLKVYLSVANAMKPGLSFSLRYQGQEVATLKVAGDVCQVIIKPKTISNNKKYFNVSSQDKFSWDSPDAAKFRRDFKKLDPSLNKSKIHEHAVESLFLKEMANKKSSKFGGTLKDIQPVHFADCPFQFPLPISGNTGKPKATNGHIDILARRRVGNNTRISIWELKKPDTIAHAIEQAYIYAVTLIKMLRSRSGDDWYSVIGFNGKIPSELIIESVMAVCIGDKKEKSKFVEKIKEFKAKNELRIGSDEIKLFVAHYVNGDTLKVDLIEV